MRRDGNRWENGVYDKIYDGNLFIIGFENSV